MIEICELCNGINKLDVFCANCGRIMGDGGPLSDYFGPYSPYMSRFSIPTEENTKGCLHLFTCPNCNRETISCCKIFLGIYQ